MGIHTSDSDGLSNSKLGNSESMGEAAIIMISIGSIFVILCAATIIYGLHRRRRQGTAVTTGGASSLTNDSSPNPTDFMKSLGSWDRCHSIDEILEKRRRSVWTLEFFENYGSSGTKTDNTSHTQSWSLLLKLINIPPRCLKNKYLVGAPDSGAFLRSNWTF